MCFRTALFLMNTTNSTFYFRKDKTMKCGDISWRCCKRVPQCKARLRTNGDITQVVATTGEHSHDSDSKAVEHKVMLGRCKVKAQRQALTRPSSIIREELKAAPAVHLTQSNMNAMRQAMYRERRKIFPPLPKSRLEAQQALENFPVLTSLGEEYILANDEDSEIVLISCATNLAFLCEEADELFGDGTFKHCAKFWTQLYSVHGTKNGHYIPLLHCLLPNMTRATYVSMWRMIQMACQAHGHQLQVARMHFDFEEAAISAFREVFPGAEISGCRFHLGQSWYRRIQKLGLTGEYREKTATGKWLCRFFGLAFLPPNEVEDCFVEDILSDCPDENPSAVQFADYVLDNYISARSKFPPTLWAEAPSQRKRTTNGAEAFHSHFNKQFYSAHPNVFLCISVLEEIQRTTYIKQKSCDRQAILRKQDKEKLVFVETKYAEYIQNQLERITYLKSVCYKFLPTDLK